MVTSPKPPATLQAEEEQRRKAVEQMPGAALDATYTIASGAIKPLVGLFAVDTEGAAASDDLDRLTGEPDVTLAGFPGHGIVLLRAAHTDRTVVVKHLAGGSYDISLAFGSTFALDNDRKSIALQLRGTRWYEIDRDYGGDSAARRTALALTKVAELANPASPGDNGKFVGASSGNVAWTPPLPGGDGFLDPLFLGSVDDDEVIANGNPLKFEAISGFWIGYGIEVPIGAHSCRLQCVLQVERSVQDANHDFVTIRVARSNGSGVYDSTGLLGARGLVARSVFYRPFTEERLTNPYVAIGSSILPVVTNGSMRIIVTGKPGKSYRVKAGKAKSWIAIQWF